MNVSIMTSLLLAWAIWGFSLVGYAILRLLRGQWQRMFAALLAFLQGIVVGPILVLNPSLGAILFALIMPYSITNTLRFVMQRMHLGFLAKASFWTYGLLHFAQLLILLVWTLPSLQIVSRETTALWCGAAAALFTTTMALVGITQLIHRRHYSLGQHRSDQELPTVSVIVPARNETEQLLACLEAVVASDYPKLEVIVYDDCSQARTADIIKSFAQAGVRFVAGSEPPDTWLARNFAIDTLVDQANGEWVLCIGTDTMLQPETISQMIRVSLQAKLAMLSVLPMRKGHNYASVIAEPLRYWWELGLHRFGKYRPAVSTDCWMILRRKLQELGTLDAVSRMMVPESYFATQTAKTHQYGCLQSTSALGVTTERSTSALLASSVRLRYPQLHKQPAWVGLYSALIVALLYVPIGLIARGAMSGHFEVLQWLSVLIIMTSAISLAASTYAYNPAITWLTLLLAPVLFTIDIVLAHISMWRYEFSVILWRQRNICLPVMHVYPKLPKV
jgi:hypothetical protein